MNVHVFTDNLLLMSAFSRIFKEMKWSCETHRAAELEGFDFDPDASGIVLLLFPKTPALSRSVNRIANCSPRLSIILFMDAFSSAELTEMSNSVRAIVPTDASEERIKSILTLVAEGHTVMPVGNCEITGAAQVVSLPRQSRARQLTNRELQILQFIAKGHSNKAIARLLDISTSTVQVHASAIFRKLEVDNRTQAARAFDGLKVNVATLRRDSQASL